MSLDSLRESCEKQDQDRSEQSVSSRIESVKNDTREALVEVLSSKK